MPTTLSTIPITSLRNFSTFIEDELPKSQHQILWFRGTGKSDYKLQPSIHRNPVVTLPEKVIELETQIIERFNQRSIPFLPRPLDKSDDWEILFFMQHYGIPTRLLDWSENPFIALYFALTSAPFTFISGKKVYDDDAGLWVLDPVKWNGESLKDFSYTGGILSVYDSFVNSFRPRTHYSGIREKPVAIFGTHNSARIVSQRGVFTIFGKKLVPMEDIYISDNFPQDCLRKLIFPKDNIEQLLSSLTSLGITDSVVYPDLDGLSKELRRFFKFLI